MNWLPEIVTCVFLIGWGCILLGLSKSTQRWLVDFRTAHMAGWVFILVPAGALAFITLWDRLHG